MARASGRLDEIDYEALGAVGDYLLTCRDRGYAERTIWERLSRLEAMAERVGRPLEAATEQAVRSWWRGLASRQLQDSTRACYLSHAREFYRWAIREGLRADDPTARIDPPRLRGRLPRDIDVAAALPAIDGIEGRARLAVDLALRMGLRCIEICRVHPARDLRRRAYGHVLRIEGKGGRERVIPVPGDLLPHLRAAGDGWLFPSARSSTGHWSPDYTSAVISQALHGAGLATSAHPLRHTAGTALLEKTGDISRVQAFLGHASLTSTQVYARSVGPSRADIEGLYASAGPAPDGGEDRPGDLD